MARIAVDAMGGDRAPGVVVEGAVQASRELGIEVVLVGDEGAIRLELARLGAEGDRAIRIRHASQRIEPAEAAGQAVRRKADASIRVAVELVAAGEADAVLSAGHSGALLAASLLVLGRLPAVLRPAVVAFVPTPERPVALLDAGANVDVKALHLVQFALIGEVYARRVLQLPKPRVGVLSNGEEPSKGTQLTRTAVETLRRIPDIDFRGYAEGRDLFSGEFDVVATDGFTGNVVLKTMEGQALAFGELLRRSTAASPMARLGSMLLRPAFDGIRRKLDWAEHGAAPLIGCDGSVFFTHGRSDAWAIRNAIRAAAEAGAIDVREELSSVCAAAAALLPED